MPARSLPAQPALIPTEKAWRLALGALAGLTVLVYLPALGGEFVWDDRWNLVQNPYARGFSAENLAWAFTQTHLGHYQPLTWLSYMVDHALWGMDPFGYHLTNVLLHAANAVLFGLVAERLLLRARVASGAGEARDRQIARLGALVAAAVFALHPLRVESVAWVTERRDVLSSLFFFLAVLGYLRAVARGKDGGLARGPYLAALGFFVLSLMSKALGMALPAVLLVLDGYPLRRFPRAGEARLRTAGRLLVEKLPFLGLTLAVGLIAAFAQAEASAMRSLTTHDVVDRIMQAFYGLFFYVKATVGAVSWAPLYEIPYPFEPFALRYVLAAAFVLGLTALLVWKRKAWPAALAAWLCYGLLVFPVLGVAQSGSQIVADRYSYLATLGLALLLGWGAVALWRRTQGGARTAVAAGTALVLLAWAGLTVRQTQVWADEERLWIRTVEEGPSGIGSNNLGAIAMQRGEADAAVRHYADALWTAPGYPVAFTNLKEAVPFALNTLSAETAEQAEGALRRSLDLAPREDAAAYYALGLLRLRASDLAGATADLQRAVDYDPENGPAWLSLGVALVQAGRMDACAEPFRQATRLVPDQPTGWVGLGTCLGQTGRTAEARQALARALDLDPGNARAQAALAALGAS